MSVSKMETEFSEEDLSNPSEEATSEEVELAAPPPRERKVANPDYISDEVISRYMGQKQSLDDENLRMLLRDSRDSIPREFNDFTDLYNSPSFSKLTSPYHLICRERYRLTKKSFEHQFQKEIKQLVEQQTKAFDAVCLVRVLALTSLWPPLHTRRNLDFSHRKFFQITPKQKKRLAFIMGVDWSKT